MVLRPAVASVLFLFVSMAPPVARAAWLRCDSHTVTASDAAKARIVARRVAGSLAVVETPKHICMNPGSGSLWFEAAKEPQPDGSELRHSVRCGRGRGAWSCELTTQRHAFADFDVAGAHKHVEMDLPMVFDVDQARQIVARAFAIGPTVQRLQACGAIPEADDTSYSQQSLQELHDAFSGNEPVQYAQVAAIVDGKARVIVSDTVLSLVRSADGTDWQLDCWDIEVVVT